MLRVVEEAVDFAHTLAIDQINRHDILCRQAAGVAQRERRTFDRAANRAPDVDFGEAILEQAISFLRQKIADAARRGLEGIVVVHELGRRASALFAAFREQRISNNVIENHYPLGAGYPLQQALDFGVINGLDLIGIVKVLDRGFVLCENETVGVEREFAEHFAAVTDNDASLDVFSGPAWDSSRRIIGIVDRLRYRLRQVIQSCVDDLDSCVRLLLYARFHL